MCGIVGIFSFNGQPPFRSKWLELVNHLSHRGPDEGAWWADGPFFLGHRRLAIIDPVGGGQPMGTDDGSLVVTFNGEIYNYIELREELKRFGYVFRTESDTEVLLHGYHRWGEDLPTHLTGMFAFAIADRRKNELFLARDRFGEKPLMVRRTSEYIAFSSELRPLAALPDMKREIDFNALGGYLSLNYVPGTATMLKGIKRFSPSSWKLFSNDSETSARFWSPPDSYAPVKYRSLDDHAAELHKHLDDAVKIALRSDVPVGLFLSGGIDSSLIAESAVRQGGLSKAYVLDFEEKSYSEYNAAKFVAKKLNLPLERVVITPEDLNSFLQIVEHADDPLADSSALALWTICRFAAQEIKVVLGGDGGDELFGGYLTYQGTMLHKQVVSRLPAILRQLFARLAYYIPFSEQKVSLTCKLMRFLRAADLPTSIAHFIWNGTWLPDEAAGLIEPEALRETIHRQMPLMTDQLFPGEECSLLKLQLIDIAEYLQNDILVKTDRMSMAHGLEMRAPYLNHSFAEWALTRPSQYNFKITGQLKHSMRHAARKLFGSKIANRPKQGFSLPVHAWIRKEFSEIVRDLLSFDSIKKTGFLNAEKIQQIIDDHFSKKRSYGFEIWGLMVLVAWYKSRVEKPPEPPIELPLVERII